MTREVFWLSHLPISYLLTALNFSLFLFRASIQVCSNLQIFCLYRHPVHIPPPPHLLNYCSCIPLLGCSLNSPLLKSLALSISLKMCSGWASPKSPSTACFLWLFLLLFVVVWVCQEADTKIELDCQRLAGSRGREEVGQSEENLQTSLMSVARGKEQ